MDTRECIVRVLGLIVALAALICGTLVAMSTENATWQWWLGTAAIIAIISLVNPETHDKTDKGQ